jgi:hypothetical protein
MIEHLRLFFFFFFWNRGVRNLLLRAAQARFAVASGDISAGSLRSGQ